MIIVSRLNALQPNFLCDMILMLVDDGGWVDIMHYIAYCVGRWGCDGCGIAGSGEREAVLLEKRAKLMSSYQFLRGISTQNEKTKVATLGFRSFTYH